jgi:hypothetical protein
MGQNENKNETTNTGRGDFGSIPGETAISGNQAFYFNSN